MRIYGSPVELVILDVDGVILDVVKGLRKNLEAAASHFGLSLVPIVRSLENIASGKLRIKGNARDSTHILWPYLDKNEVTAFVDHFHEIEHAHSYDLISGSLKVIAFFRKHHVAIALATNNPMKSLLWRLEAAKIDLAWFTAIVTKDDGYLKPHPKMFDPIFQAIPVCRDRALYVGDLQVDWDMAQGAGVLFAAVLSGGVPREAFLQEGVPSVMIFSCLADLLRYIVLE